MPPLRLPVQLAAASGATGAPRARGRSTGALRRHAPADLAPPWASLAEWAVVGLVGLALAMALLA